MAHRVGSSRYSHINGWLLKLLYPLNIVVSKIMAIQAEGTATFDQQCDRRKVGIEYLHCIQCQHWEIFDLQTDLKV